MAALQSLLSPQVLTKVVSQKAAVSDWLINLLKIGPGQSNEVYEGHGRYGAFHIYDHVRKLAKGRAPGTAAGRSAANPMGQVLFTYPRMHDSISLPAEVIHNLSLISDPAMRDQAGADMIKRQTGTLGEMGANWMKAMTVGMLRDSLYYEMDGEDVYFNYSTGTRINFQMPAGNKNQLNMLGAGNIINASWATATTDIPDQLGKINAAFQSLNGGRLCAAIIPHSVFNDMRKNEHIQTEHGTSVSPYLKYDMMEVETELGKVSKNVLCAQFKSFPGCMFYITDEMLDVGADQTPTKMVGDANAIFFGFEPGQSDTVQAYQGSEPIAEYDGAPENVKVGMNSWSVKRSNPTATELYILHNALTVNHIPTSVAYATVKGF